MANLAISALSVPVQSGNIPGVGFQIFVKLAFSQVPQTGELLNLNSYFPTFIIGGRPIKDTVNDGAYFWSLVSGASTSSYLIQGYGQNAASGVFVLLTNNIDASAVDGQTWTFWGY